MIDNRINFDQLNDINRMWAGKSGVIKHPALWHMLDVAAVAQEILSHRLLHKDDRVQQAFVALIALHDLGKISASFKAVLDGMQGSDPNHRHWRITGFYIKSLAIELETYLGQPSAKIQPILRAIICHHGDFKDPLPSGLRPSHSAIGLEAFEHAKIVFQAIQSLFPRASLDVNLAPSEIHRLSWQLSGLMVQSDWIGSNPTWFPPCADPISLEYYWQKAQAQAKTAVFEAGLFRATPSDTSPGGILPQAYHPRPMQQGALSLEIEDGPGLYILEDMTGSGKTEAALILAKRLLAAGQGNGIFFALPTMATSNAIFERLHALVPKLLSGKPTFALSHSKNAMNQVFKALRHPENNDDVSITPWLADQRRLILFADIAVGTIDQALMSILSLKFNTLRQWALSNKVLIIDEAHTYDPYMEAQLSRLLYFHRYFGGSAILMSATLPNSARLHYAKTYFASQPRSQASADMAHRVSAASDYPQIMKIGTDVTAKAIPAVQENRRCVDVRRLSSEKEVLKHIDRMAGQGACVVWIRNAVDDAIAAYDSLKSQGKAVTLLHARFAMGHRLDKEEDLKSAFGKDSTNRAGRIVVATQVIEQSLDLDFDTMVSDLAPIGSLIQRAGRLWRHRERPTSSRGAISGPELAILSPDPKAVHTPQWLSQALDRGAYVYNVADLWRAAVTLFDVGQIQEPEGLRPIIEAALNPALEVPAPLQKAQAEQEGKKQAETSLAGQNMIHPERGLAQMQHLDKDEDISTRLGVLQTRLYLAYNDNGRLAPLCGSWPLSEVSMSAHKLERFDFDQERADIAAIKAQWPKWMRSFAIVECGVDGHIAQDLYYDQERGLHFKAIGS